MQQTQTQILSIGDFLFDSGESLPDICLAYECYGQLNEQHDNVILLNHALTGSHHAYGYCEDLPEAGSFWQPENYVGWWNLMIGPGRPLDSDVYFIICPNFLGSCYGSSGPCSLAPDGEPWGSRFPLVTAADQARAQMLLLDSMDIDRARLVTPSAGGLVGITAACLYPQRVRSLMLIGVSDRASMEHKLSVFEQIIAIEMDEDYRAGRYALAKPPLKGLALARIICHKLFVDQGSLAQRARGGSNAQRKGLLSWYTPVENTQSYMLHQGTKFARRYDANAYIRIVNMWASFDLAALCGAESDEVCLAALREYDIPLLIFSIDTDFCFLSKDIEDFSQRLLALGVRLRHYCIRSEKGHDSFLLEPELYAEQICSFLSD